MEYNKKMDKPAAAVLLQNRKESTGNWRMGKNE